MMMREEKVIVTMLVKDSLNQMIVANIIKQPYIRFSYYKCYLEDRFPHP